MRKISRGALVWNIAIYDFKLTVREKSALFWAFVMPFVFIFVFGQFGGSSRPSSFSATLTLENNDSGPVSKALVETLRRENIDLVDSLAAGRSAVRTLVIPPDFSEKVLSRQRTSVHLRRDEGSNAEAGETASVAIFRGIVVTVTSLLEIEKGLIEEGSPWISVEGDSLRGNLQLVIDSAPDEESIIASRLDSLMSRDRNVLVNSGMAGRAPSIPGGFQSSVPGNLVMFVLMTMAFSGIGITFERKTGVLMRIGASPAGRSDIIAGKLLGRMIVSTLQILIFLVAGKYLFGISLGSSVPALTLLMLSFAFCAGGFSLVFGTLFGDPDQMTGFAIIASLVMSALGGCWWPLEIVPGWARTLAYFFPTGWTISGIHKLISFGYGFSSVVWHISALIFFGLVFLAFASWRLRWDR